MRDVDLSLPSDVNVQYYIAHDLHYSPYVNECFSDEYLSILHCNIRNLTANFDNLQTMLSNLYFPLSIVGLTEIKLIVGQNLLSNTYLLGNYTKIWFYQRS